jgi:hypothetical protein
MVQRLVIHILIGAFQTAPSCGGGAFTIRAEERDMADPLMELLQKVVDEASFNRFLTALREDCEKENDCRGSYWACAQENHWETKSTAAFLRSVEDWATRGDFADGQHHGEPLLRRFATMLYVGRNLLPEERPYDQPR